MPVGELCDTTSHSCTFDCRNANDCGAGGHVQQPRHVRERRARWRRRVLPRQSRRRWWCGLARDRRARHARAEEASARVRAALALLAVAAPAYASTVRPLTPAQLHGTRGSHGRSAPSSLAALRGTPPHTGLETHAIVAVRRARSPGRSRRRSRSSSQAASSTADSDRAASRRSRSASGRAGSWRRAAPVRIASTAGRRASGRRAATGSRRSDRGRASDALAVVHDQRDGVAGRQIRSRTTST